MNFKDIITGMPNAFNAAAADGLKTTIQFRGTGEGGGDFHLMIDNGACSLHEGVASAPAMTIETPADVWAAISNGELDGAQAFMSGKYKVTGDMAILMRMKDLFPRG